MQKLLIPGLVLTALLIVNINSIIHGINDHNTARVVIAAVSSVVIIVAFTVMVMKGRG